MGNIIVGEINSAQLSVVFPRSWSPCHSSGTIWQDRASHVSLGGAAGAFMWGCLSEHSINRINRDHCILAYSLLMYTVYCILYIPFFRHTQHPHAFFPAAVLVVPLRQPCRSFHPWSGSFLVAAESVAILVHASRRWKDNVSAILPPACKKVTSQIPIWSDWNRFASFSLTHFSPAWLHRIQRFMMDSGNLKGGVNDRWTLQKIGPWPRWGIKH